MPNQYSNDQLRLAARLYYLDGLNQTEVARFVNVSQAKISRLLAMARERGIVRISVENYEPRNEPLEGRIREQFGLQSVAVIKTLEGATVEDARRTLGHFGSSFVSSLIPANSVVAIAGGRTMRELVQVLPEETKHHFTVIQAMGSVDSTVGPVDAFELGHTMARRWGGSFYMLNTPAFVPDRKTRDSFLALAQIRSVWRRLDQVSVALVGIGTLDNSVFVERGVLSATDLDRLRQRGAVGEICGRFYDTEGRECDSPWRDRVISISLKQLRGVPQVVGVVAGADRSNAIVAAIRGGLLKSLIIDEATALALLTAGQPTSGSSSSRKKGDAP